MLQFRQFIKEDLLIEKALSQDLESDDKGKLHELLLAKYLHPNQTLPEHHRSFSENDEHAGTPEQVHDRLMKKIGGAAYNEIDSHASQTARALKDDLEKHGHIGNGVHIGDVHWTSNPDKANVAGDHEKTTGVKDVNSNADLIVTLHDKEGKPVGFHGISAKYGSQEPNYRNPGLDSLEKIAKLPPGNLTAPLKHHTAAMEKLGYTGSADQKNIQTKIDEMDMKDIRQKHAEGLAAIQAGKTLSGKKKIMHEHLEKFIQSHDALPEGKQQAFLQQAKQRAETARASNLAARTQMAQSFADGLSKQKPEELANIIRQNVSPNTHIPHTVVHSKVKNNGEAESIIKPMHSLADEHLAQFKPDSLHVAPGNGVAVTIKGIHAKTGKPVVAARYSIKATSGAHKGANGIFKLK